LQFKGKTVFKVGLLVQMIPHTLTPVSTKADNSHVIYFSQRI